MKTSRFIFSVLLLFSGIVYSAATEEKKIISRMIVPYVGADAPAKEKQEVPSLEELAARVIVSNELANKMACTYFDQAPDFRVPLALADAVNRELLRCNNTNIAYNEISSTRAFMCCDEEFLEEAQPLSYKRIALGDKVLFMHSWVEKEDYRAYHEEGSYWTTKNMVICLDEKTNLISWFIYPEEQSGAVTRMTRDKDENIDWVYLFGSDNRKSRQSGMMVDLYALDENGLKKLDSCFPYSTADKLRMAHEAYKIHHDS